MSKTKDSLYRLIKSLSKSEKGYFKKFASLYSTERQLKYLVLFDVIDSMEEYDEKILKKKISGESIARYLGAAKGYLYQLILKSLKVYYSSVKTEWKIQDLLMDSEILFKKGLSEDAHSVLNKARELSSKQNSSIQNLSILRQDILHFSHDNEIQNIDAFLKKGMDYLETEANDLKCKILNLKVFFYSFHKGHLTERDTIEKLIEEAKVLEKQNLNFSAKATLYTIFSICYTVINDFSSAYQYMKKHLSLFESNEQSIWEAPEAYSRLLHNFCYSLVYMKRYEEFWESYNKIKEMPAKYGSLYNELMRMQVIRAYHMELDVYCLTGRFREGVESAKSNEPILNQLKKKLSKSEKVVLYANSAKLYFGVGDFRSSLKWIRKILDDRELDDFKTDAQRCVYILNLMVHTELQNHDNIEYFVRQTKQYFSKLENLQKSETIILRYFSRNLKMPGEAGLVPEWFSMLKNELKVLEKDPREESILSDTLILPWLESKISGKTIQEIVRSNYLSSKPHR